MREELKGNIVKNGKNVEKRIENMENPFRGTLLNGTF